MTASLIHTLSDRERVRAYLMNRLDEHRIAFVNARGRLETAKARAALDEDLALLWSACGCQPRVKEIEA